VSGGSAAIKIANVSKVFGTKAEAALGLIEKGLSKTEVQAQTGQVLGLHDVSISVRPGEIFVVMGLSGSGKSTLIRHVNRLIDPTSGTIEVNGENVLAMDPEQLRDFRRTKIAMVFQRFGLLPHRSVIDNVAYGLEVRGVDKAERREVAAHWIERVGLAGYERSRPNQLSGGQQQRVGLARALAVDAPILLMDEAFSALDPLIRSGMQEQLLVLQKELNKTILFITHDFDEAIKIGDRIGILNDGVLIQTGLPTEIVLHPADTYVTEFVRDVNKARVIKAGLIMEEGEFEDCPVKVAGDAACEDILPLFAEHEWVGVTNEKNVQIGRLTAKRIIGALARYSAEDA
jgi:glycine betaine/proline transport system ATP-binding protein